MQFAHIGVPTTQEKNWIKFVDGANVHVTDPDMDEFGVEWLKFRDDSPMPELIKTKAHAAFYVDNLDRALAGKNVIVQPFDVGTELRCAFIDHDGVAIELCEKKTKKVCGCCCG